MLEAEEEAKYRQGLGKAISTLRSSKYGVREFARIAGIEHHQLLNIESGKVDIRLSTLRKISKGLGVEPKELLDFSNCDV